MFQIQWKNIPIISVETLQLLCVIYITIWAISPPLAYGGTYRMAAIAATALWIGIEFVWHSNTFLRPSLATVCAILFIIYSSITTIHNEGSKAILHDFQLYIFLLFMIFFEGYRRRDIKKLRIVFWVSLVLLPIWMTITLNTYKQNNNISRTLSHTSDIAKEYSSQGVGGYALVYSVMIAIPILLYLAKTRSCPYLPNHNASTFNKLMFKGFIFINLLLSCAVVIKAGYSTSILLVICSIITILMVTKKSPINLVCVFSVLFIAVTLLPYYIIPLLDWIIDISLGTLYCSKAEDLRTYFVEGQNIGTVQSRTEKYMLSIDLFLENPIMGAMSFTDIGGHSAILDRFARCGLFFGTMFAYTVFYLPLQFLKKCQSKSFGLALAVLIVVVSFSFVNNIFAMFGFILFIFYPVAMTYVEDRGSSLTLANRYIRLL